MIIPAK